VKYLKQHGTNANAIILFHIDNEEELNTIYEEFPMGLKWHQWMAVVEWATSEPYSFIMFNTQQSDPNQRIVKQFIQPLPLDWIKQTFI
jgi:sulfatase maturation enzyme AslB (radical SAM superfamily)